MEHRRDYVHELHPRTILQRTDGQGHLRNEAHLRHRHHEASAGLHEHLWRRRSEVAHLEEDCETPLHQRGKHLRRHHLEGRGEHIQFLTESLHRLVGGHLAGLDPTKHLEQIVVEKPAHGFALLVGPHVEVFGTHLRSPHGRTGIWLVRVEEGDASGGKIQLPLHPLRSHHAREHGNFCRYVGVLLDEVKLTNGRQRFDARAIAPLVGSPLEEAANDIGHVIIPTGIEHMLVVDQDVGRRVGLVRSVDLLRVVAARHTLLDGMEYAHRRLLVGRVVALELLAVLLGKRLLAPLPDNLLQRHVRHFTEERGDAPFIVFGERERLRRHMLEHQRRILALENAHRSGADRVTAKVEFVNLRVKIGVADDP